MRNDETKQPKPTADDAFGNMIDVEDPEFEEMFSCLSPPEDLANRIKEGIDRRPTGFSFVSKISAIAAILIVGLLVGLSIPGVELFSEQEAEAASLQNHISGYTRNSELVAEEVKLLSQSDPSLVQDTLSSELKLASLNSSAKRILYLLKQVPDSSSNSISNREDLRRFFDNTVVRLDKIQNLTTKMSLGSQELQQLVRETSKIVLPKRLKVASTEFLANVGDLNITNPEVEDYLRAKRFVFLGDFDRAAEQFKSSGVRTSSSAIKNLSLYWLTRCYGELGMQDQASMNYQMLPKIFQQQIQMRSGSISTVQINISMAKPITTNFKTLHMLKLPAGNTAVVTVFENGSVEYKAGPYERISYPSVEEFKKDKSDIFNMIFKP